MDNPFHAPEADVISPDEGYAPLKILGFSGRLGRLRYLVYSISLYTTQASSPNSWAN